MDLIKQIETVLQAEISAYKLAAETGIPQSSITDYRNGNKKIENMPLKNAQKLLNYKKELDTMYGQTKFEGETYQLLNNAEYDQQQHADGKEYYVAKAEKDGISYTVYFEILDGEDEDASHACDWENASYVEEAEA